MSAMFSTDEELGLGGGNRGMYDTMTHNRKTEMCMTIEL